MRAALLVLFALILVLMVSVTVWASLDRSVFKAGYLFAEPWFVATFCDAYCGFITFYVWVVQKERTAVGRLAWFVAIMGLGNMAMAVYVLIQLLRLRPGDSWDTLLLSRGEHHRLFRNGETSR